MAAPACVIITLLASAVHHAAAWGSPASSGSRAFAQFVQRNSGQRTAVVQMQVNKDGYLEKGPLQYLPPNMGGDRVVRKKKKETKTGTPTSMVRRTVFALPLVPVAYYASLLQQDAARKEAAKNVQLEDGDAVTAPGLELELDEVLQSPLPPNAEVARLVQGLEAAGGPQIAASELQGKWVLPWLGGWERVWTSSPGDASLFGGPARATVGRATTLPLVSSRQFVYGPGDGGITLEYLYASPAAPAKVLLARQGVVQNLGGNFFVLDFPTKFDAFEVENKEGIDYLTQLKDFPVVDPPAAGLTLQTTYLSSGLWVLRSYVQGGPPGEISIFRRTETRSVLDRRGLVADGQLRPPDDETIRYGRLLFGEKLSDYAGWSDAAIKETEQKDKLFKLGS